MASGSGTSGGAPPRKKKKSGSSSCTSDYVFRTSWDSDKERFSTSQWKTEDLEELGVYYAKDPIQVNDLFERIRNSNQRTCVPSYVRKFADFANEALPFSFSINDIQQAPTPLRLNLSINKAQREEAKLEEAIKALRQKKEVWTAAADGAVASESEKILFEWLLEFWNVNVFNFLTTLQNLVHKLIVEMNSTQRTKKKKEDLPCIREHSYTRLIMKFTEIFFLNPEQGESKKTDIMIRNKKVGCIPDVRFFQQSMAAQTTEAIVMLIEVKRSALRTLSSEDKNWIQGRIKREVLGQIGAEMLVECTKSSFCQKFQILGLVYMRTEIIFMLLDIEESHLTSITENKDVDGKRAIITYSNSYDILNAENRKEIAEFLLWLGCLQKRNFHRYYLHDEVLDLSSLSGDSISEVKLKIGKRHYDQTVAKAIVFALAQKSKTRSFIPNILMCQNEFYVVMYDPNKDILIWSGEFPLWAKNSPASLNRNSVISLWMVLHFKLFCYGGDIIKNQDEVKAGFFSRTGEEKRKFYEHLDVGVANFETEELAIGPSQSLSDIIHPVEVRIEDMK